MVKYEKPKIEIIYLESKDIMTASILPELGKKLYKEESIKEVKHLEYSDLFKF